MFVFNSSSHITGKEWKKKSFLNWIAEQKSEKKSLPYQIQCISPINQSFNQSSGRKNVFKWFRFIVLQIYFGIDFHVIFSPSHFKVSRYFFTILNSFAIRGKMTLRKNMKAIFKLLKPDDKVKRQKKTEFKMRNNSFRMRCIQEYYNRKWLTNRGSRNLQLARHIEKLANNKSYLCGKLHTNYKKCVKWSNMFSIQNFDPIHHLTSMRRNLRMRNAKQ